VYADLPLPERRGSWLVGINASGHYCADSSCRTVPPPRLLTSLEHGVLVQVLLAACQPLLLRMAETIFGYSNSINVGSRIVEQRERCLRLLVWRRWHTNLCFESVKRIRNGARGLAVQIYGVHALSFQSSRCGLRIRGFCLGLGISISMT